MNVSSKLASAFLAGVLMLTINVSDLHAQRGSMSMQHAMMSFRPSPFMGRPMMTHPNPSMVRPMRPTNPTRIGRDGDHFRDTPRDRLEDRIERERRQWWRNQWSWNNGYNSGLYGLGYGSYGLGGYGLGSYGGDYASTYRRANRDDQPAPEQSRPRSTQEQFERLVNNPTTGEIVSGQALNAALSELRKLVAETGSDSLPATVLALSDEALAHVNFTRGAGNIALLRSGGRLSWPVAFSGPENEELRGQLAAAAQAIVLQAQKERRIDSVRVAQLAQAVERLNKELPGIARNQALDAYVEAKTFANNLGDAVVALQQPDAINHFNGEYVTKANTVPDLVRWMTDKGLQFAPAIHGDEAAYETLQRALAAYGKAAHLPTATTR
ncbi:MAG: hypothetical protein ACJ8F7_22640 [Gemmataceae bacterium]